MNGALGILGGTFDPVHFGHLRLAQQALETLGLARVRFIPAGAPWHRRPPRASASERLAMARIAIADNPAFELDDTEVREAKPGYTVETLERLRGELGCERPVVVLLGSDSFAALATWHRWREIFGLAHLFIAQRPGHALAPASVPRELGDEWRRRAAAPEALRGSPAGCIAFGESTLLDISASGIRALLASGRSPRYLLPEAVLEYIRAQGLYAAEDRPA